MEGFAATLEETLVSDLVLHVADASLAQNELEEQIAAVTSVLNEIGADELPAELVLNKIDEVDAVSRKRLANRYPDAVQISALNGDGLDELRARLAARFADRFEPVRLFIPHEQAGALSELYGLGAPIEERRDEAEGVYIRARLSPSALGRFSRYLEVTTKRSRASR